MTNRPTRPFPRRFLFRGSATGISGHIRRPHDYLFPTVGSVSLPISGGLARDETNGGYRLKTESLGRIYDVDRVLVEVSGDYEPPEAAAQFTHGNHADNDLPTLTRVRTEIDNLEIWVNGDGIRPRVCIGRIEAEWRSLHLRRENTEPRISLSVEIEGFEVDGCPLEVEMAGGLLAKETYRELKRAWVDDRGFRQQHAHLFGSDPDQHDFPCHGNPVRGEASMCTVVKAVSGKVTDTVRIDGHRIDVKGFGSIHLGEMVLSSEDRRVTLLRMDIGSDKGGDVTVGGSGTDGGTWPP